VPERIEREPQLVEINKVSLIAFVMNNSVVRALDEEIASLVGVSVSRSLRDVESVVEGEVANLAFFKVKTIQDLERLVTRNRDTVLAFADRWIDRSRFLTAPCGDVAPVGIMGE
jgi:hypothetical protein